MARSTRTGGTSTGASPLLNPKAWVTDSSRVPSRLSAASNAGLLIFNVLANGQLAWLTRHSPPLRVPLSTSGVFETPPRVVPGGAKFRETLVIGTTTLSPSQVQDLLRRMSREYLGDRYHLLFKNVRTTGHCTPPPTEASGQTRVCAVSDNSCGCTLVARSAIISARTYASS